MGVEYRIKLNWRIFFAKLVRNVPIEMISISISLCLMFAKKDIIFTKSVPLYLTFINLPLCLMFAKKDIIFTKSVPLFDIQ